MTDDPLEPPALPPPKASEPVQPAETADGAEAPPSEMTGDGLVSSVRDITPSWWEMMLDETDKEPEEEEPRQADENHHEEEALDVPPTAYDLTPEQAGQSLWDLAPGLKSMVDEMPAALPAPAPDLADLPGQELQGDEEERLPAQPLEEASVPVSEAAPVPEETPASVWEVVPSWWRVYSEEKSEQDAQELDDGEKEDAADLAQESLPEPPISAEEIEEPASLWDYAPELQRHLDYETEPVEEEAFGVEEEATEIRSPELPGWFDPNDSFWRAREEEEGLEEAGENLTAEEVEWPAEAGETLTGEEEIPEAFSAGEADAPEAADDGQLVESVWETVPTWWRDYTTASPEEPLEEEPLAEELEPDTEALPETDAPTDQERPAGWSEITPELSAYIEDTIAKAQEAQEPALLERTEMETDATSLVGEAPPDSELDLPEDLVEELEKNAAEFNAAHSRRRSALPFILAIAATLLGVLVVVWFGGNSLMSAIQEMRAAASVVPTALSSATPVFPFTLSEFPFVEKIEAANPVALEIQPGVIFALQEGKIVAGMWSPQQPEWLPGAELPRVIAIPWQDEYIPIVTGLDIDAPMRLAMSNQVIEQYQVTGLDLVPRDQTGLMNDNKPSLLIIFSRNDDQKRWVIFCERVQ